MQHQQDIRPCLQFWGCVHSMWSFDRDIWPFDHKKTYRCCVILTHKVQVHVAPSNLLYSALIWCTSSTLFQPAHQLLTFDIISWPASRISQVDELRPSTLIFCFVVLHAVRNFNKFKTVDLFFGCCGTFPVWALCGFMTLTSDLLTPKLYGPQEKYKSSAVRTA